MQFTKVIKGGGIFGIENKKQGILIVITSRFLFILKSNRGNLK